MKATRLALNGGPFILSKTYGSRLNTVSNSVFDGSNIHFTIIILRLLQGKIKAPIKRGSGKYTALCNTQIYEQTENIKQIHEKVFTITVQ